MEVVPEAVAQALPEGTEDEEVVTDLVSEAPSQTTAAPLIGKYKKTTTVPLKLPRCSFIY